MRAQIVLLTLVITTLASTGHAQEPINKAHYESKNAGRPRVVIFVHGFTGDAANAWKGSTGPGFPVLFATDPKVKQADVFVASYETRWVKENNTIIDLANKLYTQFDQNGIFKDYNDILFVCHSLGGLIVDRMLLMHPEVAAKTSLIQYFGTPHEGAFSEKYDLMFSFAATFGQNAMIPELRPGSNNQVLVQLDKDWRASNFENIKRYCAVEDRDTVTSRAQARVVPYFSGAAGCNDNVQIDIVPADHIGMVKPTDRTGEHGVPYGIFLRNYIATPYRETKVFVDDTRAVRDSLSVDCNHTKSDQNYHANIVLNPQLKEELLGGTAELVDYSNIQGVDPNPPQVTKIGPGTLNVFYGFNGLDRNAVGDCPGGGHATLVVHPTVKQQIPITDGE